MTKIVASGKCGDNLTWTLDDAGLLTITGTGKMTDWSRISSVPWYAYADQIKSVVIGSGVTSIGSYAFYNCRSLESVTIPDSVTGIGEWAFCWCTALESVTIGSGVTIIGNYAFSHCTALESVTIGSGVTIIGGRAFIGCTALTSVTIPASVASIGAYAFANCTALKDVRYGGTEEQKSRIAIAENNTRLIKTTWCCEGGD